MLSASQHIKEHCAICLNEVAKVKITIKTSRHFIIRSIQIVAYIPCVLLSKSALELNGTSIMFMA